MGEFLLEEFEHRVPYQNFYPLVKGDLRSNNFAISYNVLITNLSTPVNTVIKIYSIQFVIYEKIQLPLVTYLHYLIPLCMIKETWKLSETFKISD